MADFKLPRKTKAELPAAFFARLDSAVKPWDKGIRETGRHIRPFEARAKAAKQGAQILKAA